MKNIYGKIYLMLGFSLAGTSVVTGSVLTERLSGRVITPISLGIMLICLFPFYGVRSIRTAARLKKRDLAVFTLQAGFGIVLFRLFLLTGVGLTSTVEAGILTGTTPAITSILAFLVLKETCHIWTVLGITSSVLGIILIQNSPQNLAAFSFNHVAGNLMVLCAAASESTFNIISRKYREEGNDTELRSVPPMIQMYLVSLIAFLLSLIPGFYKMPVASLSVIGWKEWLALGWYGLVVTALAFIFFFEGVRRSDAYTTAAFSGMIPLTSMLLSLYFLKEPIGLNQWAGGSFIILSMLLIGRQSQKRRQL
ncbi:DMT family transporter [Lacrimispora defluvii]|uniref:EamA family transporter n=1 Tax=Lacrimispora defluvii TaxID=2719233 RepID=A0ABX1VWD3_9FIRM|nr:DMT family transporter [Lacrimispora defluvii]NNJ31700.1 EamA family transporter [Lacrimispora defluvii]